MKVLKNTAWFVGTLAMVAACGDDSGTSDTPDGSAGTDTAEPDTAEPEADGTDTAEPETNGTDTSEPDTATDTSEPDTAEPDTDATDTGGEETDGGVPDGGVVPQGDAGDGGSMMGMGDGGGDAGPPPPPDPIPVTKIQTGEFALLDSAVPELVAALGDGGVADDIVAPEGIAQLVVDADGMTTVSIQVLGLPDGDYGAHVHALPCDVMDGGGHYKIDPSVTDTMEENEIWPALTSEGGIGTSVAMVDHAARDDAQSVVVHDPTGFKMLCADLRVISDAPGREATGEFSVIGDAEIDQDIAGTATIIRDATVTAGDVSVTGLDPDTGYIAHVHALDCATMDGGGHYKVDTSVTEALEQNEIWIAIDPGEAVNQYNKSGHVARADAQSIVIHRQETQADGAVSGAPKVACADLDREYPDVVTMGESELTADGEDAQSEIQAMATMTRSADGMTSVMMEVEGAEAGAVHGAHVHNQPCSTGGGGHYMHDTSVEEPLESNEAWVSFEADDSGDALVEASWPYTLRAEARSIVIHGDAGVRLACIDLIEED